MSVLDEPEVREAKSTAAGVLFAIVRMGRVTAVRSEEVHRLAQAILRARADEAELELPLDAGPTTIRFLIDRAARLRTMADALEEER